MVSKVPYLTFHRKKSYSGIVFIGTILLITRREM